jgi:hypothetical protein
VSEKRKILEMLAAGQVNVEQALDLLAAIENPKAEAMPRGAAKLLSIRVDHEGEAKVRVNVPAPLAKFALQFVPKDVRGELEGQGINLAELLDNIKGDLPEGRLVDIEADEDGKKVRVVIEVA